MFEPTPLARGARLAVPSAAFIGAVSSPQGPTHSSASASGTGGGSIVSRRGLGGHEPLYADLRGRFVYARLEYAFK